MEQLKMRSDLDDIVLLQTTIDALNEADQRLNTIPSWMSDLHEEHSSKNAEIEAVRTAGSEADMRRREGEASLSDAQEKLKHYQEQVSKVSTQREYGALLKEIDTVKNQIVLFEQQALEAIEVHEKAAAEVKTLEEDFRDLDERYQSELGKWEGEKPSVAKTLKELQKKSDDLRSKISRNNLVLFDRLQLRGGGAISQVQKSPSFKSGNIMWHCGACNYNVRPQIVVEIRNGGAINQCDGCKRILYWEEEAEST